MSENDGAEVLRAVGRLREGAACEELCLWLLDYHRGRFAELPLPVRNAIADGVSGALAHLPAGSLRPFWDRLSGADALARNAMLIGLDAICAAHASAHLLAGIEQCTDHRTRSLIVDCLEEVGDPEAIPGLARLHRETAQSDWTLSRKIDRAIRAIDHRNLGGDGRTLLRPTGLLEDGDLVRPASDADSSDKELLHPAGWHFGQDLQD
jgi:hypothetical protein